MTWRCEWFLHQYCLFWCNWWWRRWQRGWAFLGWLTNEGHFSGLLLQLNLLQPLNSLVLNDLINLIIFISLLIITITQEILLGMFIYDASFLGSWVIIGPKHADSIFQDLSTCLLYFCLIHANLLRIIVVLIHVQWIMIANLNQATQLVRQSLLSFYQPDLTWVTIIWLYHF